MPGPERPGWPFLVAGGLIYAAALLGMWIVLAGPPDGQDLVVGSAAAVLAVGAGYLVSERGKLVPAARVADLRTLAACRGRWWPKPGRSSRWPPARRPAARCRRARCAPCRSMSGRTCADWPAARREAVLTALLSAAPNTIVVDIDMEAGTALVHQLAGAPEPDAHPAPPG